MPQGEQQPQHHPADGPAFWNITHNLKPGELESDLSRMFFNQAIDLQKENEALLQHIKRLEEAGDEVEDTAQSIQDWSGTRMGDALDNWRKAKEAKP